MTPTAAPVRSPPGAPESTYRLQFHAGFRFADASALVPYLADLGITHVYASPYLMARPGSTHGYDVADPTRINPEIGTEADLRAFAAALREHGMAHILDIVPNHMGVATNDNPYWNDVLAGGRDSRCAGFFDIDWHPAGTGWTGRLLLPVLGGPLAEVLGRGELKLVREAGAFAIAYWDRRFPVAPGTLPPGADDRTADAINADAGRLAALLDAQHYRLADWRTAADEINYRRFFDINDLAGLRMEDPAVFEATHALIRRLVADGTVAGLRIDHPDGLRDPKAYLQRLQSLAPEGRPLYVVAEKILVGDEPLPEDWPVAGTTGYEFSNLANTLFVNRDHETAFDAAYAAFSGRREHFSDVVRRCKREILDVHLRAEFDRLVNLLLGPSRRLGRSRDLTRRMLAEAVRGVACGFPVYRTYVDASGVSERDRRVIAEAAADALRAEPSLRPDAVRWVADVLLRDLPPDADEAARAELADFADRFQQFTGPLMAKGVEDTALYRYVRLVSVNVVGGEPDVFGLPAGAFHRRNAERRRDFPRCLLATSTHDTKRSEDVRARLSALSELPGEWTAHVARWAAANAARKTLAGGRPTPSANDEYLLYQTLLGAWPLEPWTGLPADARADFVGRMQDYLLKAAREAKLDTSWTAGDPAYEEGLRNFTAAVLSGPADEGFLADFLPFADVIAERGMFNSLAQVLLKTTSPGVPDVYQGQELWDFSLVDPDNRRPVDYALRRRLAAELASAEAAPEFSAPDFARLLWEHRRDGRVKMWVTRRALRHRRANPGLFAEGDYGPLWAIGPKAAHVVAFARRLGARTAITVVPRLPGPLLDGAGRLTAWGDTRLILPADLATAELRNVLTGERFTAGAEGLPLQGLLTTLPVALLEGAG